MSHGYMNTETKFISLSATRFHTIQLYCMVPCCFCASSLYLYVYGALKQSNYSLVHAHDNIEILLRKTCLDVDPSIFPVPLVSSLPREFLSFASSLERSTLFITWLCRGGVGESVSRTSTMLLFATNS